jgi:hypothetical protein
MTQQNIDEINLWLNSGRNYSQGVALFDKHSRNLALKRIFPGKEKRFASKLSYELRKLVSASPTTDIIPAKPTKPSGLKPIKQDVADQILADTDPSLPKVVRRIITEFSKSYNHRSMLHTALKKAPTDNFPPTVEIRCKLVGEISGISDRLDELHQSHQAWNDHKTLPDEEKLFPTNNHQPKPEVIETLAGLIRARLNLMKTLNKDYNLLNFSSLTKQPMENPMRDGPKRNAVDLRIKTKLAKIKELTTKIDGINKSIGV